MNHFNTKTFDEQLGEAFDNFYKEIVPFHDKEMTRYLKLSFIRGAIMGVDMYLKVIEELKNKELGDMFSNMEKEHEDKN